MKGQPISGLEKLALNDQKSASPQPKYESTTDQTPGSPTAAAETPKTSSEAFNYLLECVGSEGRFQWFLFSLMFGNFFVAMTAIGGVFLAAEPAHWCVVPDLQRLGAYESFSDIDFRNGSIPRTIDKQGQYSFSRCEYYDRQDYPQVVEQVRTRKVSTAPSNNVSRQLCSEWNFDTSVFSSSIVTEWQLVCSRRWLMSAAQSTYMLGFMVGGVVLSQLADKLGRRTVLRVSVVLFVAASVAAAFSPTYLVFITLRFFVAAFGSGICLSNFVIMMECQGPNYRTMFGSMNNFFFSWGICALAGLAYYLRDWRQLQLWTALPSITMFAYFYLTPESPRWLMMVGREEDALIILRKIASWNGGTLPEEKKMEQCLQIFREEKSKCTTESFLQKLTSFNKSMRTLLGTRNMRRRSLVMFYAWFTVSMIYYGLAFNGSNLRLPPHLMILISGGVELFSIPFNIWIVRVLGRRFSIVLLLLVCGVSCVVTVLVPVQLFWLALGLVSLSRFFVSMAFSVAWIYATELVPSRVRNLEVGMSSTFARLGSTLAPFIVDLMGGYHYAFPSAIFALVAITAGALCLLLPETGSANMPEDVEEIERMKR